MTTPIEATEQLQQVIIDFNSGRCKIDKFHESILTLATLGANLAQQDNTSDKYTLLHHLVLRNKNGKLDGKITELLNNAPELVNVQDGSGNTPLQVLLTKLARRDTTMSNIKSSAMILVEHGASLAEQESYEYGDKGTLLHHLVLTNKDGINDAEILKVLEKKPNPVDFKDGSGKTPLQALLTKLARRDTTMSNIKSSAMILVEHGASLAEKESYQYGDKGTLLHHLVLTNKGGVNNTEILRVIAKEPNALEAIDGNGATALQVLMAQRSRRSCSIGDFNQSAQLLIEQGADVTKRDISKHGEGFTLIHHLIITNEEGDNDEVIEQILKSNPELINATSSNGSTPLQTLLELRKSASFDEVNKLIGFGSRLDCVDKEGKTLLHSLFDLGFYQSSPNFDVAKFLLEQGLDLKAKTNNGSSMWHLLSNPGVVMLFDGVQPFEPAAAEWLFEQDLDINQKNNKGQTILHIAAEKNHVLMIEWLLKHKADPTIKNSEGQTGFQILAKKGFNPRANQAIEIKISNLLNKLKGKAQSFTAGSEASDAASKLHTKLSDSFATYQAAPYQDKEEAFKTFKKDFDSATRIARPVLEKHSDSWWNSFTANLVIHVVLLACTLGVGNIVALSYNYYKSPMDNKSMFFKIPTNSDKLINELEETTEALAQNFPGTSPN